MREDTPTWCEALLRASGLGRHILTACLGIPGLLPKQLVARGLKQALVLQSAGLIAVVAAAAVVLLSLAAILLHLALKLLLSHLELGGGGIVFRRALILRAIFLERLKIESQGLDSPPALL